MLIAGLTGSIGMGKSTVAGWLKAHDIPVLDADAAVHQLYDGGAAVGPVGALVPEALVGNAIDRGELSAALQHNPELFAELEAIVHPLVRQTQIEFLCAAQSRGAKVVVLDIPLLFETGGDARVDLVIVVHAAAHVQRDRVLARPGMTPAKFEAILARQMPSEEKCRYADFVIETDLTLAESQACTDRLAQHLLEQQGTAFARIWAPSREETCSAKS
jgi:dephospho-CoA kinase